MDQWNLSRVSQQMAHKQAGGGPYGSGSYGAGAASSLQTTLPPYQGPSRGGQQGVSGAAGGASATTGPGQYGNLYAASYGSPTSKPASLILGSSSKPVASTETTSNGRVGVGYSAPSSVNAMGAYGIEASKYSSGTYSTSLLEPGQKGGNFNGPADYLSTMDHMQYATSQSSFGGDQIDALRRYSGSNSGAAMDDKRQLLLRQQQLLQAQQMHGGDYPPNPALRGVAPQDFGRDTMSNSSYGRTDAVGRNGGAGYLSKQSSAGLVPLGGARNFSESMYGGGGGAAMASYGGTGPALQWEDEYCSRVVGRVQHFDDPRLDDKAQPPRLRHESELLECDLNREREMREREREREYREREREHEREIRERGREREREREKEREREREREREIRLRALRSPPKHRSPIIRERAFRKESPRREPLHRHVSPPKDKRRDYTCKAEPYCLIEAERDYQSVSRRYSRLYVSTEFSKVVACWVKGGFDVSFRQPVSFEHEAMQVGAEETKGTALKSGDKVKTPRMATVWNVKVLLMGGLGEEHIPELLSEKTHGVRPIHFSNFLKFVVLRKDHSAIFAPGGTWEEAIDGGDPAVNDTPLIHTATRCMKDSLQLDLTKCKDWKRFLEVHYDRVSEDGSMYKEVNVMLLPDLSGCLPSVEEWQNVWRQKKAARQNSIKKEKELKSTESNDSPKEGAKSVPDSKPADDAKKDKPEKKEKHDKKVENKADKKEKQEKKEEKKEVKKATKNQPNKEKKEKSEKEEKQKKQENQEEKVAERKGEKKEDKDGGLEARDKSVDSRKDKVKSECDQPRDKSVDRKDKVKSEHDHPPLHPGFFLTTKHRNNSKMRSMTISLDGLLDYDEKDREDGTFELSLFAEALNEMLQHRYGSQILSALQELYQRVIKRKKEEKKRAWEDDEKNEKKSEKDEANPSKKRTKVLEKTAVDTKMAENQTAPPARKEKTKATAPPKIVKVAEKVVQDYDTAMEEASQINFDELEKGLLKGEVEEEEEEEEEEEGEEEEEEEEAKEDKLEASVEKLEETKDGKAVSDKSLPQEKKEEIQTKPAKVEKKTTLDTELLMAFRYFDRNGTGYIKVEDLRRILHALGKFLSNRQVKELVSCALNESTKARDERIVYRKLVEKEVDI